MATLVEKIQQIRELSRLRTEYDALLAVLGALKSGEIALENLTVSPGGWSLSAPAATGPQAVPVLDEPQPADGNPMLFETTRDEMAGNV